MNLRSLCFLTTLLSDIKPSFILNGAFHEQRNPPLEIAEKNIADVLSLLKAHLKEKYLDLEEEMMIEERNRILEDLLNDLCETISSLKKEMLNLTIKYLTIK